MNQYKTFQDFLATGSVQVPVAGFILNLVLVAVLSFILSRIYIVYGTSLSNRRAFSQNFILIAMATMVVITIVKSSLALSLGLVGALSIVRFRTAVKEPEELAYLFINIALGLGFGADQRLITAVAFAVICAVIVVKNYFRKDHGYQNLYLTISSRSPQKIQLNQIVETLKKNCTVVDLKRFDESSEALEASFLIEFDGFDKLNQTKKDLQSLGDTVKITFLDNRGII